jgi:TRAP-type C4-dicarboxylate transport system substrate-binding protein
MIKSISKRKIFLTIVAFLMVFAVSFAIAGCSKSQGNGEKTVELVMGHPFSGEHPVSRKILIPLAEELKEKSDGRIRLTIHPAGAITSPSSVYEDVISGAFDIGWTLQGYTPGRYPLTEVVELPFLFNSSLEGSTVLWRLFEEHPALQKEYDEVKVLGLWVTDPGEILSKKPVHLPEDLAGMRIRFAGPMQEAMLNKFGAVPVGMPAPEMYDSLERGIIDGVAIGYSTIESYRLHEVIKNMTSGLEMFVSPQVMCMNLEKWESLSPEDQELLASLTGERIALKGGEIYDSGNMKGYGLSVDGGVAIYEASPEVKEQWESKTAPLAEEWIASVIGKGLPAQDLYNQMLSIINNVRQ